MQQVMEVQWLKLTVQRLAFMVTNLHILTTITVKKKQDLTGTQQIPLTNTKELRLVSSLKVQALRLNLCNGMGQLIQQVKLTGLRLILVW